MSLDGSFEDATGREVIWSVVEVHDYDSGVHVGGDIEDSLYEADRVFYQLDIGDETYYRWVAGPFESISGLEAAIIDEVEEYA